MRSKLPRSSLDHPESRTRSAPGFPAALASLDRAPATPRGCFIPQARSTGDLFQIGRLNGQLMPVDLGEWVAEATLEPIRKAPVRWDPAAVPTPSRSASMTSTWSPTPA